MNDRFDLTGTPAEPGEAAPWTVALLAISEGRGGGAGGYQAALM